jgi:ATP phosphoribosyltransferase
MIDCLTFALPSKGAIAEPTYNFLRDCGLKVSKPNPRQYTGSIPAIPGINLLFQRVKDVVYKVSDGTAHIGITGLDVVRENPHSALILIHEGLSYGHCKLVVAVPESWLDVENMNDLAEVAFDFRENKGRNLRVATMYPQLTRQFLHSLGIHYFTLVKAEGAIEAAPTIGYADIIVDLTQTGTTLRENHLKMLSDGVIVESEACLIGNRTALRESPRRLELVGTLLEYLDASLIGKQYQQITVNIQGQNADEVARKVAQNPITQGLLGPNISPIFGAKTGVEDDGQWHTVTTTVHRNDLLKAVQYLREIGGQQVAVSEIRYVFLDRSPTFKRLIDQL